MFDFIAIDFETANSKMSSACSVGIVAVENHKIVESYYSLLNPRQSFNPRNMSIHGITPEMVKDSPSFDELMPELSRFFNEHIPVVAHNARFDISVLKASTSTDLAKLVYIDSMDVARPLVEGSRGLENCAKQLGIPMNNHHNAAEDAEVCAEIVMKGMDSIGAVSLWEYIAKSEFVKLKHIIDPKPEPHRFEICIDCPAEPLEAQPVELPEEQPAGKKPNFRYDFAKWEAENKAVIVPTVDKINENGALFGKTIVFTGELTIERLEARQIAVNAGAIEKFSVTKKTDYLVVGKQDKSLVGADGLSSKEERAYELNNSGKAHIVFLNEKQFLNMANSEACV